MDSADRDPSDAAVEHVGQMLRLAKSKHQEAIALLGTPDLNALPRLHEVLRLLEDVELLAGDAATLVGADVMKAAIKELHFQQASVQMAIAQLQAVKSRSPWGAPWPWIALLALGIVIVQALV
jgi:hypothetical protein